MIAKRMVLVVALFASVTAAAVVMGHLLRSPPAPTMALLVTALGAVLIGLAAGHAPPGDAEREGLAPPLPTAEEER